jgi:segregation and condensation protein A
VCLAAQTGYNLKMSEKDVNQQPPPDEQAQEAWPDGAGELRLAQEPDDEMLVVDLDGFEGPLDLLLDLARHHKIDLQRISILALVDQYLAFIDRARKLRLEFAADYLVMAAWLAYLKSRLLIPGVAPTGDGEPADMAARLAFRLQRLQAMRNSAQSLMDGPQLGRDVFVRGAPEPLVVQKQTLYGDTLLDLLKAYAERRTRSMVRQTYTVRRQPTWSIKEAREALERLMGAMDDDWGTFDGWLQHYLAKPETRRSVRASSFTASLELAREGALELRQDHAFQPIFLRRRIAPAA